MIESRMHLAVECPAETFDADRLAADLLQVTGLRGEVAAVPPGSLPNDGKVIDDTRRYE